MQKKSASASFIVMLNHRKSNLRMIDAVMCPDKRSEASSPYPPAANASASETNECDANQTRVTLKRQIKWHCQPIYSIYCY